MPPWTRQAKSSGLWSAQYRDAQGTKRYTTGHATKKAAERAAVLEESEARRGQRRDPTSHRMRYEQWAKKWWPTRPVKANTARQDWPRMNHHVLGRWGQVRLSEISRMDVQAWVNSLTREPQPPRNRPLAAATAAHCLRLLSSSLRAAVRENIIDSNPASEIVLPTKPQDEPRYLSDEEVEALFAKLDGWSRLLVELLVDSGLRLGEATGLHRHRCHLDQADPHITVLDTWDPDHRTMYAYPKGKRRREVPISSETADALEQYWADHPALPATCGERHDDGSTCQHPLAVPNARGRPVDQSKFSEREWAAAEAASGVTAYPYQLRHTYARRAILAGFTLEELQALMGHVSFTTTQKYAGWLDSEKQRRARQRELLAARKEVSRREAVERQRKADGRGSVRTAEEHDPAVELPREA